MKNTTVSKQSQRKNKHKTSFVHNEMRFIRRKGYVEVAGFVKNHQFATDLRFHPHTDLVPLILGGNVGFRHISRVPR